MGNIFEGCTQEEIDAWKEKNKHNWDEELQIWWHEDYPEEKREAERQRYREENSQLIKTNICSKKTSF